MYMYKLAIWRNVTKWKKFLFCCCFVVCEKKFFRSVALFRMPPGQTEIIVISHNEVCVKFNFAPIYLTKRRKEILSVIYSIYRIDWKMRKSLLQNCKTLRFLFCFEKLNWNSLSLFTRNQVNQRFTKIANAALELTLFSFNFCNVKRKRCGRVKRILKMFLFSNFARITRIICNVIGLTHSSENFYVFSIFRNMIRRLIITKAVQYVYLM